MDNGMEGTKIFDCTCRKVKKLEEEIFKLKNNGKGKPCPKCIGFMVNLTTIKHPDSDKPGMRKCSCGYSEPFVLKPGQKSILEKNKIG